MFCTEGELLKITVEGSTATLNEVLQRVYNKAIEQALCHIPDIVNKLSKKVQQINVVMDRYLKDNPSFKDHQDIVIKTVQAIEIEHTGMQFEDVLQLAQPIIEKKINLVKQGGL